MPGKEEAAHLDRPLEPFSFKISLLDDAAFELGMIRDRFRKLFRIRLRRVVFDHDLLLVYVRFHRLKAIDLDQGRFRFRRSSDRSMHADGF